VSLNVSGHVSMLRRIVPGARGLLARQQVQPTHRAAAAQVRHHAAGAGAPSSSIAAAPVAAAQVTPKTAPAAAASASATTASAKGPTPEQVALLMRKLRRRRLLRALAALAVALPALKVYLAVRPLLEDGGAPQKDAAVVSALSREAKQETPAVSWHWLVSEASDRLIRDVFTAARIVMDYSRTMRAGATSSGAEAEAAAWAAVHQRSADKLLKLCEVNRGIYIKLGQHVAQLEYMLPPQYVQTMAVLTHAAPRDSWATAAAVLQEELGDGPGRRLEDVFESIEHEPIASASLAQVHVARLRGTGEKVAVKIQHRGESRCLGAAVHLDVGCRLHSPAHVSRKLAR
jgi:hypothetical protein